MENIQKQIQELLAEAYAKIEAAEKLADEHKLSFSFGLGYGMGGTYYGDREGFSYDDHDHGWCASSQRC